MSAYPFEITREPWMSHGLCVGDEDWYLISHESLAEQRQAKRLCTECPVRTTCLQWALDTGETQGVLGGMTEQERRPLHKKHQTGAA